MQLCELVRVEEQQYIQAVGKDAVDPAEEKKAVCLYPHEIRTYIALCPGWILPMLCESACEVKGDVMIFLVVTSVVHTGGCGGRKWDE